VHPNEILNRNSVSMVSASQAPYDFDPRVPVGKRWGPVTAERWSSKVIRVHWLERFTNQTGFTIERADDSAFTQNTVSFGAAAGDTCYIDNTVTAGRKYYYRVRAHSGAGQSGYSYTTSATALDPWLSDIEKLYLRVPTASYGFLRDEAAGGGTITLNGVAFPRGISTHAPARLVYDLGGLYSRFAAQVGIDDDAGTNGSVTFSVYLDSDTVAAFASGVMRGGNARQTVDLDVAGRQSMKLVVTDGGDGMGWDHADWADAKLTGADVATGAAVSAPLLVSAAPRIRAATGRVVEVSGLGRAAWVIRVLDASGRLVESLAISGQQSVMVDMSSRPSGVYLVRVIGPSRTLSEKVVAWR
jgi:hypothetical protein